MLASRRPERPVVISCFQPSLLPDTFLDHRTHQHRNQNQPREEGLSSVADSVVTSSAPVPSPNTMSPSQQSAGFAQTPPTPSPDETVCLSGSWSLPGFGVSPACPRQVFSSPGMWTCGPGGPLSGGISCRLLRAQQPPWSLCPLDAGGTLLGLQTLPVSSGDCSDPH